ncbi:hypothetical protein COL940_010511 [Colletotrichum noveboracense]|nr:hypothetical protein COL940_010511 [Colletotrichum noveboracense]
MSLGDKRERNGDRFDEDSAGRLSDTDPIGFFPPISHKIQYFEKTSEYISNHSSPESLQEVKKLWEKLIPRAA